MHRTGRPLRTIGLLPFIYFLAALIPFPDAHSAEVSICDYTANRLHNLEDRLKKQLLGDDFDPGTIVGIGTKWEMTKRRPVTTFLRDPAFPEEHKVGFASAIFSAWCPRGNANTDHFTVNILYRHGKVHDVEVWLEYEDQNFVARDEELDSARYNRQEWLDAALISLVAKHSYSLQDWKQLMKRAGFLEHKECRIGGQIYLVHTSPPFRRGTLSDRLGGNFNPNLPLVRIFTAFSDEGRMLISELGRSTSGCRLDKTLYAHQAKAHYFKTQH